MPFLHIFPHDLLDEFLVNNKYQLSNLINLNVCFLLTILFKPATFNVIIFNVDSILLFREENINIYFHTKLILLVSPMLYLTISLFNFSDISQGQY